MSSIQVNSGASSRQAQSAARTARPPDEGPDLYEMMKQAREQADAARERYRAAKPAPRYGDGPIGAYARLARARKPSEVSAAAGFARRQIARLKAAKQTDPDNAKRIQAAISQLQKAVRRAGKKARELDREELARDRQEKLAREERTREAQRQRQELARRQALRKLRESGYLREAEIDDRMQAQIAAVDMQLREQAQKFESVPSAEAAAQAYAAGSAPGPSAGEAVDVQA